MAKRGRFVDLSNNLAANDPKIIEMTTNGFGRERLVVQGGDERTKFLYQALADGDVFRETGPRSRPRSHKVQE